MPLHAPLVPDPLVPYARKDNRTLFAVCKGREKTIRKYLKLTPFEYVDDRFIIMISDFSNCDKIPFMGCDIICPVKYKNTLGGYFLYVYENEDHAIAAGRELWGYPKKYGDVSLIEEKGKIIGEVVKRGETLVHIECDLSKPLKEVPKLNIRPYLNIHAIPKPDGPGIFSMRIIARDPSPDFKLIYEKLGETKVTLGGTTRDPVNELGLTSVLGGGFTVGDFLASEEHGWGVTVETLI